MLQFAGYTIKWSASKQAIRAIAQLLWKIQPLALCKKYGPKHY
jgi:hypothetical protein